MGEQLVSRMDIEVSLAGGGPAFKQLCDTAPALASLVALDRWEALPPVLQGFLLSLSADRLDDTTIGAFADWLEEHGQTAEGQRVRLLRPQPGDVLVLWPHATAGTADYMALDDAARAMSRKLGLSALVMGRHDQRVEAIDPEQLRAAGWVREEEVYDRLAVADTLAREAEREACAQMAERVIGNLCLPDPDNLVARMIRARGD